MSIEELKERLMSFGLRVIRMTESLPRSRTSDIVARQLIRCATSVGANYRAACRARSKADFVAKMGIVEEECDESLYWMEILTRSALISERRMKDLTREANEILSIVIASIKTARGHR